MLCIKAVEYAAHLADTLVGIDGDRLGSLKVLARVEVPAEAVGVDAHYNSRAREAVDLRLKEEVAAVDEVEAVGFALILVGGPADYCAEWILMVTRRASLARNKLPAMLKRSAGKASLLAPLAVEGEHIVIVVGEVNAAAHHALDLDGLVGGVDYPDVPCHCAELLKHGVIEHRLHARDAVLGKYLKGRRVVVVIDMERGHPLECGLAAVYLMRLIAHIGDCVAVGVTHGDCGGSEIASALAGVLHGIHVGRESAVVNIDILRAERSKRAVVFKH